MNAVAYFQTLSRYHRWAYRRLYAVAGQLGEADYRRDCGLFFGSIHATLNHLLLVDRLWIGRLQGEPFEVTGLDQELVAERGALERSIDAHCAKIEHFVDGLDDARLSGALAYRSTKGLPFEQPFVLLLGHVFNHATHHRGQVSAALTRLGLKAPVMDLPYYLLET
ncbi:MAG: DinB family protein [Gammaproteobacteria bacterium]|nr:DinB family protein [Gammaproteobacteria bacterium]